MKLLFIQTGGTIDKAYPKTNLGYAFEIDTPACEPVLKKAQVTFDYDVITAFKKDSTEMTNEDRLKLKNIIKDSGHDKIIITHGSDTLIESARFVGNIMGKTIVFTAAFLPEAFKDSDADFNIGMAVATVQTLNQGVYIAMNGMVFNPNNCRKNEEHGKFEKINE